MRAAAFALVFLLAAGCLGNGDHDANASASVPIERLVLRSASTEPCRISCHEPTVAVTSNGTYVSGGSEPVVWKVGEPWTVLPTASVPSGHTGGDNLLTGRRAGGFYFSHLLQPQGFGGFGLLDGMDMHAWDGSQWVVDHAWAPGQDTVDPPVDRQWLTEGDDGALLMSYNQIGVGIWLSRSEDGGATWSALESVATTADRGAAGQAGAPHRLPSGDVALPLMTSSGPALAVRSMAGTEIRPVGLGSNPAGLPQMGVLGDSVFLAWGGPHKAFAVTGDEGRTWSAPIDLGDDFTPGDMTANASPWIDSDGHVVYVMGLKETGPWLARIGADGVLQSQWSLKAEVPANGGTDHAHFDLGTDGRPCLVWTDLQRVSLACLEAADG